MIIRGGVIIVTFKTILKYIVLLVCGYKFATADKEDKTPTWYGIWVLICMFSLQYYG